MLTQGSVPEFLTLWEWSCARRWALVASSSAMGKRVLPTMASHLDQARPEEEGLSRREKQVAAAATSSETAPRSKRGKSDPRVRFLVEECASA
jgi:hypothetical protein